MGRRKRESRTDAGGPAELASESPEPAELPDQAEPAETVGPADELELLRNEVEELREKNLRLLADSRNLQQRSQRDKAEALKYAEADFARELLVVIDDLERTLDSAKAAEDVEAVADGVRIIYEHFLKVLRGRGIEAIEAEGRPFDPSFHEALMQRPSDEYPAGTVMQELARGYKMHDRVIRASRVVVSGGPAEGTRGESATGSDEEQ
jgi:molecular chaperone GrpE